MSLITLTVTLLIVLLTCNFTDALHLVSSSTSFTIPSYLKNLSSVSTSTFATSRFLDCAGKALQNPSAGAYVHFSKSTGVCSFIEIGGGLAAQTGDSVFDVNVNNELWMFNDAWDKAKYLVDGTAPKLSLTTANPAKQQSMDQGGVASRALDGNTSPIYDHGSCMHTVMGTYPTWWLVDVQATVYLQKVKIFNRVEGGLAGHFLKITVGISELEEAWNATSSLSQFSVCQKFEGPASASPQDVQINCLYPLQKGRYVVVWRDELATAKPMHFCEVQVYAFNAD